MSGDSREIMSLDEIIGENIIRKKSDIHITSAAAQMLMMSRQNNSFGQLPGMTTLNTITPCAACKLLRRRCAEECPFSPYFSPHEPHKFSAVHKVFGASNVSKLLMEVSENQRADAANSLVYEANLRLRDPVYGCMGVILDLQQKHQYLQRELHAVRAEILRYKYKEAASQILSSRDHIHSHHAASATAALVSSGMVSIGAPPQSSSTSPPAATPSSVIFSSSSSTTTSTSSLYTPSTNTTGYSSLSIDNIPFFD
ncbi:LOB domain-containing protein 15 isoform X2 [Argentina anserina]|uniref:LOB domain-containing protein 15 isoform X2 n=1 Tax=Argentina anserina TaxID=57926 RepID=UPI00217687EF|nr:LOB domain-containing protein 15 isoform X2 [Potentilla anserina]